MIGWLFPDVVAVSQRVEFWSGDRGHLEVRTKVEATCER
jgi:hypothetical protein